MRREQTNLETIKSTLEELINLVLISANIGLTQAEQELGLGDLANDGVDGEIRLLFEGERSIYISWCGKTKDPEQAGGWCYEVSNNSFHTKMSYIPVPENNILAKAVGNTLTECSIYGENEDPLSILFKFEDVSVQIGNFEYGDITYIKKPGFEQDSLQWTSNICA